MKTAQDRVMSSRYMSEEEERFQRFKVMLQQTGGDPSGVLDTLVVIFMKRDWINLTDSHGGNITFEGYFKALGWSMGDLLRFVENMKHRHEIRPTIVPKTVEDMAWLRSEVRSKIKPERAIAEDAQATKPLGPVGPPPKNKNAAKAEKPAQETPKENNPVVSRVDSKVQYGSTNADYLTARIARDNPQVFGQMKAGKFKSVRQAGIAAGIVKPTIQIPADPEAAARRLVRHFSPAEIDQLVATLRQLAEVD